MNDKKIIYNWKFWTKLFIGIIPLIAIVVVISAMYYNYAYGDGLKYYANRAAKGKYGDFDEELINIIVGYYNNKQYGMILLYTLSKNLFLVTTLGNIFISSFFIASAFNTKNEGKGKYDNFSVGFSAIFIGVSIVIFYNISMIVSPSITGWYSYLSWICLHSVMQIIGLVYFILFYDFSTIINKKYLKTEFIVSATAMNGYMIFWVIIGSILSTFMSFRPFGTMSSSGYFPYTFLDLIAKKQKLYAPTITKSMIVQLLVILLVFEAVSIGLFYAIKAFVKLRIKHDTKKNNIETKDVEISV